MSANYAKALGHMEGAVKMAIISLRAHQSPQHVANELAAALDGVENILHEDVPPHRLPDGPLHPVSENVDGRTVLEPGLDWPDTTEEKEGLR